MTLLYKTLNQVMADWIHQGLIAPDQQAKIKSGVNDYAALPSSPFGLMVLVSLGAFFAAFFIIGLLMFAIDFNSSSGPFVWGAVFIAIALGMSQWMTHQNIELNPAAFLTQISFYFMMAGKILMVVHAQSMFEFQAASSMTAVLLLVITYPLFPLFMDRFLTGLLMFSCFYFDALQSFRGVHIELAFHVLLLLELGLFWFCFSRQQFREVGYAALFVLIGELTLNDTSLLVNYETSPWLLATVLLALQVWVVQPDFKRLLLPPMLWLVLGAVLLGWLSAPAILLIAIALLMGIQCHERRVLLIALLYLPVFLFLYYYNLNLTLFYKAVSLCAGGAVLLVGWALLHFKLFEKGNAA